MPGSKSKADSTATTGNIAARRRPARPVYRALYQTAGPEPDTALERVLLNVGTITGTHGIAGELKLRLATDDPDHLRAIKRVWLDDEPEPRRLRSIRFHAGMALIKIAGVNDPETGAQFRGAAVRIAGTDARPLEPGEFYLYQVIGLTVFDEAGQEIGLVSDLLETGANDVFVVKPAGGGKDELFPNHPDVVLELDPAARRMVVRRLSYADE